jgi:hypothetical protein
MLTLTLTSTLTLTLIDPQNQESNSSEHLKPDVITENFLLKPDNILLKPESQNILLKLARKTFYEGQILYLEHLQYSAEIKYMAAYILASEGLKENRKKTNPNPNPHPNLNPNLYRVTAYEYHTLSLLSSCLLNAAVCRVSRCPGNPNPNPNLHKKKGISPTNSSPNHNHSPNSNNPSPKSNNPNPSPTPNSDDPSPSPTPNSNRGLVSEINIKRLTAMSPLELCEASIEITDNIVSCLRKVYILQKMQRCETERERERGCGVSRVMIRVRVRVRVRAKYY